MYTFVKFDNLINENNEIEAPESLKNLLYALMVEPFVKSSGRTTLKFVFVMLENPPRKILQISFVFRIGVQNDACFIFNALRFSTKNVFCLFNRDVFVSCFNTSFNERVMFHDIFSFPFWDSRV